jgi:hypothetical protein
MHVRSRKWISICLVAFLGNTAGFLGSIGNDGQDLQSRKGEDPTVLSEEDKAQLIETLRLKKSFGPSIWPGFSEAEIPLILYNEGYAFLIGHPSPPPAWTPVDGDSFQEKTYYRREGTGFQAFAVLVGELWAASLDTLGYMNRSMREQLRENIPPEKLTPVMLKTMEVTPAYHAVALLHEAFHAFQALQDRDRFQHAQKMYALEKLYPFKDEAFKSLWDAEGNWLASALREQDGAKRLEMIGRFLDVRAERRSKASLAEDLVIFERELEWLEGSAKYVEMQFAVLASAGQEAAGSKAYRIVRNRLQADFSYRIKKLGGLQGDLRFYLSGAAQAMVLDKVYPGWKKHVFGRKNTGLEDLLQSALEGQ